MTAPAPIVLESCGKRFSYLTEDYYLLKHSGMSKELYGSLFPDGIIKTDLVDQQKAVFKRYKESKSMRKIIIEIKNINDKHEKCMNQDRRYG